MDQQQFDGIARALAGQRSRRGAVGALLAVLAGGALAEAGAPARKRGARRDDVAAAKKCKNKCGALCLPPDEVCCNGVACPKGQVCGESGTCVAGIYCPVAGAGVRQHCGADMTCCNPYQAGKKTVAGGCCPAGASVCCPEVPTEGNGGCCTDELPTCCLHTVEPGKNGKPARTRGYCCPAGAICHVGACCQPGEVLCRKVHGRPDATEHRGFCCPRGSTCNARTGDCTTSGGEVIPPTSDGRDASRAGRNRAGHADRD